MLKNNMYLPYFGNCKYDPIFIALKIEKEMTNVHANGKIILYIFLIVIIAFYSFAIAIVSFVSLIVKTLQVGLSDKFSGSSFST